MYGIVNHESGGKKWESKYSASLSKEIDEVVVLDGVLLVVHKNRIKKNFVEDFDGFHFYDIPFCFENFLEGVKIGVMYDVRITHKSIGQTNEKWEENRIKFVEKYSEKLPQRVELSDNNKLKILFTCLSFKTFTGSELYVYELAKGMKKLGHDVTVMSEIGGPLTDLAKKQGIKVHPLSEPIGYKKGDGVWLFNGEVSQPNVMYRISEIPFDIIHCQHKPVTEYICKVYPDIPKICTIHSEVINLEEPFKHESIKEWIAIRPEIEQFLIIEHDIPEEDIKVIYNPIDNEKFQKSTKEENYLLFVGTVDYLRKPTIFDLIEKTKENGLEFWIVGENKSDYLDKLIENPHVKYFPATWQVEKFVSNCKQTAGIQLGRTTIEGWISGKPGWIYRVDSNGDILDINLHEPPQDIEKYYNTNVCESVEKEYKKIVIW